MSQTRQQPDSITSLLGEVLTPPNLSAAYQTQAEQNLDAAQTAFAANANLENTVWLGRRLAYLFYLQQAIDVYSEGLTRFPDAHQLYRHRGHRYISTRQFDKAIADFEAAARLAADRPVEVEPDGIPNRLNQPTSTSHFNIWYHLGLSYYLTGQFGKATEAYQTCLTYSDNPDSLCATTDWYYMTLRRLGRKDEATELLTPISANMALIESLSYHKRLLMYRGQLESDALLSLEGGDSDNADLDLATQGYGVGNWYFYNGNRKKARAIFERVRQTRNWTAFGYIAAEVDCLTAF
ncbi:MAG: hypothetical protein AAF614_08555 [Chloroflexota bacterium]